LPRAAIPTTVRESFRERLVLDTHGWQLDNREGTIYSLASMQLATAALNNQNGTLGAKRIHAAGNLAG
jgi:adhesin HecA-like repeat protein